MFFVRIRIKFVSYFLIRFFIFFINYLIIVCLYKDAKERGVILLFSVNAVPFSIIGMDQAITRTTFLQLMFAPVRIYRTTQKNPGERGFNSLDKFWKDGVSTHFIWKGAVGFLDRWILLVFFQDVGFGFGFVWMWIFCFSGFGFFISSFILNTKMYQKRPVFYNFR